MSQAKGLTNELVEEVVERGLTASQKKRLRKKRTKLKKDSFESGSGNSKDSSPIHSPNASLDEHSFAQSVKELDIEEPQEEEKKKSQEESPKKEEKKVIEKVEEKKVEESPAKPSDNNDEKKLEEKKGDEHKGEEKTETSNGTDQKEEGKEPVQLRKFALKKNVYRPGKTYEQLLAEREHLRKQQEVPEAELEEIVIVEEKKDEGTQQTSKVQLRKWATMRMNNTTKSYRSASLSSYKTYKELVAEREAGQRKRSEEDEVQPKKTPKQEVIKSGFLEYYPTAQGPKNVHWNKHWFFLTKSALNYGTDEGSEEDAMGVWELAEIKVEDAPKQENRNNCFRMTIKEGSSRDADEMVWKNFSVIVSAPSADDKDSWIELIHKTSLKASKDYKLKRKLKNYSKEELEQILLGVVQSKSIDDSELDSFLDRQEIST